VSASEVPATPTSATRRELAVARALDSARSRAENRVELFLDAARELVDRNATDFTVQEVVERSGQSLRTFYQYFAGKHELLLALFEESVERAAEHLAAVVAERDDPMGRLRAFCAEYYAMCRPSPPGSVPTGPAPALVDFAQQLLTSHPNEAAHAFAPVVELLRRLIDEADAAGMLRPGLDRRRLTGIVLQAILFNAFAAVISAEPAGADDDVLWDVLVHGIVIDDPTRRDRT
jgi:AcrR family transcriptional regulator